METTEKLSEKHHDLSVIKKSALKEGPLLLLLMDGAAAWKFQF